MTTMNKLRFAIVLSISLQFLIHICESSSIIQVYRLIQYDIAGVPFGCRRVGINHFASSGLARAQLDLSLAVVVTPVKKVDLHILNEVITGKRLVGGYLLLLPPSFNTSLEGSEDNDDEDASVWKTISDLEQILIHAEVPVPVYFAVENEYLSRLAADVAENDLAGKPASAASGGYKLVVSHSEPRKIPTVTLSNLQGFLPGLKDGDSSKLPTIAIVAAYDTFGATPELSTGGQNSAAAIATLLELSRLFSLFYANPNTRGRYNILFGLTAGGPFNFDGTKQWLASLDPRVLETIEFALCLKSLDSHANKLFIHGSKSPRDPVISPFYEGFVGVAEEQGISLKVVHKKVNVSSPLVPWEHEWFSRYRVPAVTLSSLDSPPGMFEKTGGLADSHRSANDSSLPSTIKIIAETLSRRIYGYENKSVDLFPDSSSLAISLPFVSHWLEVLSQTPRVAAFLPKQSPIVQALQQELGQYTGESRIQNVPLDKTVSIFDASTALLRVYQVASVSFDILVLLLVGTYLFILFIALSIVTKGVQELKALFSITSAKKKKVRKE